MNLSAAVARFREIDEATTSMSVGPFMKGLAVGRQPRPCKKAGYDPACRDKEWERPVPIGGVALLRRTATRIG